MPSPKRWFPVDQDINHNPKMREFMRRFGLSGLRVWLEILSISDRSGEYVDVSSESALSRLSSASQSRMKHVSEATQWLHSHGSLALDDDHRPLSRVVNYWKFHKTRETHKSLTGANVTPSPPNPLNLLNPSLTLPTGTAQEFMVWWCKKYEEVFHAVYHLRQGKEFNSVMDLLKGYPLDKLKIYAEEFFKSEEKFIKDAGYTIPVFASQINKIVGRMNRAETAAPRKEYPRD